MKKIHHDLKIGDQLFWSDQPNTLAGNVVGFTPKRDVIIEFVSGGYKGEKRNFTIKAAMGFIKKQNNEQRRQT